MARLMTPEETSGSLLKSVSEFGSGVAAGFKEDPFVAFAMKGLSGIEGVDPDGLEEIRNKTKGSTAAQFGRFVGEFGPSLLFGVGAYGAGFKAGRVAIQSFAKQVAMKDAVRTSLKGAGHALTRSELSGGAIRKPTGLVRKSLDRTKRKALDRPGASAKIQGTPGVQAAAERSGAALGIGSFVTAQELARGKSPTEALKSGAIATVLSGAFDATLVGGARLLFRGARSVDAAALETQAIRKGIPKKFKDLIRSDATRVQKLRKELTDVLDTESQQLELIPEFTSRAAKSKSILATEGAQDIVRQLRAAKTIAKRRKQIATEPGTHAYNGDGPPIYLTPMGRLLDSPFMQKLFVAPEAKFGSLGVAANQFFTPLKAALVKSRGEEQTAERVWGALADSVRKAAGIGGQEWKRGFGKNLDLAHEWEKIGGGPNAVRKLMEGWGRNNKQIETVIAAFKARKANEFQLYQVRGKGIGGKRAVEDLEGQYGVGEWIPQSSRDDITKDLAKAMTKDGAYTEAEAYQIIRARSSHLDPDPIGIDGVRTNQPIRNGPLEFNRLEKGTTRDKIERGFPINPNVWDSGFQTERAALRRINTDPILGGAVNTQKGRVSGGTIDDYAAMVKAEGYNEAQFRSVVDSLVGRTYYDESMRKWATAFTSIETALKLPLAFLANASQPVLTTTWLGYRNSAKGMLSLAKKENRQLLSQTMSVHEHIGRSIGRAADDEGLTLTGLEKVADWVLRFTGFSNIEKFNRIHGAAATQAMIRDRLARGAADRLRGTRLDSARKMFGEIGLDYDDLVRGLKAVKGQEEAFFNNPAFLEREVNAMIQGAQKTQFFPGPTRTPPLWRHPLARTILQFKTFAVGQSRFMRDAVLTEYSHGNVAPLATYLSAAPLAGELVGDARSLIRGKDRTDSGFMRGLHNASYIGGLGIVTDLVGQAQHRGLSSFLLGPAISDLVQGGEILLSGEFAQLRQMYQSTPAYQLTGFLMGSSANTGEVLLEYLDSVDSEGESKTTIDIGQRLTERIQDKR